MDLMGPKMDTFLAHIKDLAHVNLPLEKVSAVNTCIGHAGTGDHMYQVNRRLRLRIPTMLCYNHALLLQQLLRTSDSPLAPAIGLQEHYVVLLGGAIFLELAGGTLFLLNYDLGAYFLVSLLFSNMLVMEDNAVSWLRR